MQDLRQLHFESHALPVSLNNLEAATQLLLKHVSYLQQTHYYTKLASLQLATHRKL